MRIIFIILLLLIIPISSIYGLQQQAGSYNLELDRGQTQVIEWRLISDSTESQTLDLRSSKTGSDLLSFEKKIVLEPRGQYIVKITVTIPEDYENDIYLKPRIHALQIGKGDGGPIVVNVEMIKEIDISIGNPKEKISPEQKAKLEAQAAKDKIVIAPKEVIKINPEKNTFEIKDTSEQSMNSKPTCGAGTQLVNGVCTLIKDEPTCGAGTEEVNGVCQAIQSDNGGNFIDKIIKQIQNIFANLF